MKKNILGVIIDDVNISQAVGVVESWLSPANQGKKYFIVTPNPEIIMMARNDKELKEIINNASLRVPDGVGLKLSGDIVCNTPGIDLMEHMIKLSQDNGFTVGFLGGKEGVANKASECLKKKYPKLNVVFAWSGGQVDVNGEMIGKGFNAFPKTDILFVAFGPPKQEKWIAKNLDKIPVKVAMGVGGSFDIISGNIPRASKWIRKLRFEWLFRLVIEPWRIKRQLTLLKYLWLLTINK